MSSPIVVGNYLYRLRTPGFLQCWEMATGKEVYSERLLDISSAWASPIADPKGHLFFANAGKSYVVQAGPECRILDAEIVVMPPAAGALLLLCEMPSQESQQLTD